MSLQTAIWKDGQVILDGPASWPEGRRLVIQEEAFPQIDFLEESEQSGDPIEIQRWIDDLRSIPPMPENPEQEANRLAWQAKMAAFNLDAVRKQFRDDAP